MHVHSVTHALRVLHSSAFITQETDTSVHDLIRLLLTVHLSLSVRGVAVWPKGGRVRATPGTVRVMTGGEVVGLVRG